MALLFSLVGSLNQQPQAPCTVQHQISASVLVPDIKSTIKNKLSAIESPIVALVE